MEGPIHIAAFPRWNCRDPSRGRPSVPPAVWAVTGHPIGIGKKLIEVLNSRGPSWHVVVVAYPVKTNNKVGSS